MKFDGCMAAPVGQDRLLYGLLGMAESFRSCRPPKVHLSLQCLEAILVISPPNTRIEARARLQLGTVLLGFTKNVDLAKLHLEKSVSDQYWERYLKLAKLCFSILVGIVSISESNNTDFLTLTLLNNQVFFCSDSSIR